MKNIVVGNEVVLIDENGATVDIRVVVGVTEKNIKTKDKSGHNFQCWDRAGYGIPGSPNDRCYIVPDSPEHRLAIVNRKKRAELQSMVTMKTANLVPKISDKDVKTILAIFDRAASGGF